MRRSGRWRHSGRGVAIVGLLAVLAVGCTVGPAANRAARMGPVEPTDDGGGPSGENGDPSGLPTGDPSSPPVQENPAPADASGSVDSTQNTPDMDNLCCFVELPDGDLLVGEQDTGVVSRIDDSGNVSPVGTIPRIAQADNGALLGLAIEPDFDGEDDWLYVYFADSSDNRIGRYPYTPDDPPGQQLGAYPDTFVTDIPKSAGGGPLAFGPDGMLYAGTGDEVLRMDSSGSPPPDNPDPASAVYASGFTDVEGLALDPVGRLWVVDAAGNGTVVHVVSRDAQDGTVAPPMEAWQAPPGEAQAPTGLAYGEDSRSLWLTTATDQGVWRIPLDGEGGVVAEPELLEGDGIAGVVDIAPTVTAGDRLLTLDTSGRMLTLAVT
ncbi:PQQ-dependent sugar dehydrogenase [Streptomyces sp. B6B3]|uniref:PQQ-dependent sugar dehydrogenase n=1 Tax=Streptomyces sp. B6B3 TaxID=3153570 RepID=UPI00325D457B